MTAEEQIRRAIKKIAGERKPIIIPAKIKDVNEQQRTCTVEFEGIELTDVRLTADKNSDSYILPVKNTYVLLAFIENSETDAIVIAYSEIEKIVINNGKNGGLIKIKELEKELKKINSILQAMMNVIKGSAIPEPGNGSPSAFQTALKGALAGKILPDYSKIENKKILH